MQVFQSHWRPAVTLFLVFSVITGVLYPALTTGLAQLVFPDQAQGRVIVQQGQRRGFEGIGQLFDQPQYFWGRPSATPTTPYNAAASAASNWGTQNPDLLRAVQQRVQQLQRLDPDNKAVIPVDLVTASASGLDPHISLAAALYQLPRVARIRQLPLAEVHARIARNTQWPILGFIGEPIVHVLRLNLALDDLTASQHQASKP